MRVLRIIRYFVVEAAVSLLRSWRVSLLATFTIAMSVFVGGVFMLLGNNLSHWVGEWQKDAKILVYLQPDIESSDRVALLAKLQGAPWVRDIEEVPAEQARRRFREVFPSVGDLLEGWQEDPLPSHLELGFVPPTARREEELANWLRDLREAPGVIMVDDDRDWLRQLSAVVAMLRTLSLAVGGVLLGAAIFTIASVVRLTAYLYRDEIEVLRMVGATELYLKGPFYLEGLAQGLAGSLAALGGLFLAYGLLAPRFTSNLLGNFLFDSFLPTGALLVLVLLGTGAGLFGAVISLRREKSP